MKPESFASTSRQLLMLASLIDALTKEELVEMIEYIDKAEEIGIKDRAAWEKEKGPTELLKFIALRFLDIKTVLPEKNKKAE